MKWTLSLSLIGALCLAACNAPQRAPQALTFDGNRALAHAQALTALGPRVPGSPAHRQAQDYLRTTLEAAGWQVRLQQGQAMGHSVVNLYAFRQSERPPDLLFGTHYDTRPLADRETPARQATPIPGANDGASGAAVLLTLAESLPPERDDLWLVFFDLEDSGNLPGYDWSLGAQSFVQWLETRGDRPQAVVIVDMVGDAEQEIYYEAASDPALNAALWSAAADLGYTQHFIPQVRHNLLDDHRPFIQAGIPAALLIDFDYPYWHTLQDTPDKLSAASLGRVGGVLLRFLFPDKTVTVIP